MTPRKDGERTRQRILQDACALFGEQGLRDTTHSQICERAGVNLAAINYHFGSKEELYRAAFDQIAADVERNCPPDGGVDPAASPEDRLAGLIRAAVRRALDPDLHRLHRLRMLEAVNSTGLLDDAFAQLLRRYRSATRAILGELLGPDATAHDLELCELSVVSQWRFLRPRRRPGAARDHWRFPVTDVDAIADHIISFSLAGIAAVRQQLKTRTARGIS